jgi:hypothetical protein
MAKRKTFGKRYGRYVRWEGMTWPLHVEQGDDSVQWRLRYGTPSREDILFAASVMSAYASLIIATEAHRREVVAEIRAASTQEVGRE